ncbi:hypothetical protein ACFX11_019695 [Malus domestica]
MTYVLSAMFGAEPDQPATMEDDYLTAEPMMAHVSVEVAGEEELGKAESSKTFQNGPFRIYTDKMVFSRPNMLLANHLKPIYVAAHLEGVPFKRVLIDEGAAVNVLPAKQMKKIGRGVEDLIPTDLTVSSFSGAITKTHGILPLEMDLGSKQIMLAFFVVDCTSTYGALLGRDWIHQSLAIPSTLHQQVAVYHEAGTGGPGADKNGRPTKNNGIDPVSSQHLNTINDRTKEEGSGNDSQVPNQKTDENREELCGEELEVAIRMAKCIYDLDGPDDLPESLELVEFLCTGQVATRSSGSFGSY